MNKQFLFLLALTLSIVDVSLAQSRKLISQYQFYHGYLNPSLSGYSGSNVVGLVRNQWGSLEGNPRTLFLGADLEFSDFSKQGSSVTEGKNSAGLFLLSDIHGAFRENQILLNYSSRIRVSEKANIRMGIGLIHQAIRLDGNQLTFEQQNDPRLQEYLGMVSDQQFFDINLGVSLTHPKYYFGYSVHRINGGKITGGDDFFNGIPIEHLFQAGIRENISPELELSSNFLYRSWNSGKDILDMNLQVMFKKTFWLGMGHRFDFTSNVQGGVKIRRLSLGYTYEFPLSYSYLLAGNIQELSVKYSLFDK